MKTTIHEINDDIFARILYKSYKTDCTTARRDLRYLKIPYIDFSGKAKTGELICNHHIASALAEIFDSLYSAKYQIEKIRLVDEYDACDELSMSDNNSSCFNFRFISYTNIPSKHGLGLAVDINPLYNPYVKKIDGVLSIEPANASPYVDRSRIFPHKIEEGDLCLSLFRNFGFEWGGDWTNSKDYQHFEVPDGKIKEWYK